MRLSNATSDTPDEGLKVDSVPRLEVGDHFGQGVAETKQTVVGLPVQLGSIVQLEVAGVCGILGDSRLEKHLVLRVGQKREVGGGGPLRGAKSLQGVGESHEARFER